MKKVLLLIIIFMLTFSSAFSQNSTYKEPNTFLDYMQGRTIIGFNFMPSLNAFGINLALDSFAKPMVSDIISGFIDEIPTSIGYKGGTPTLNSKKWGFGVIFSYEFTVLPFMALAVDAGFVDSSFEMNANTGGANALIKYKIIPYSFGIKFFTGGNAPWGFYLYPKVGGTVLSGTISYNMDAGKIAGNIPTGGINITKNESYNLSTHGMYASLEIGWRIQLFPKTGKDWPIQIGIDIALFDIGYYFIPWAPTDSLASAGLSIPEEFIPLANIRLLPMPKLGFSIRF